MSEHNRIGRNKRAIRKSRNIQPNAGTNLWLSDNDNHAPESFSTKRIYLPWQAMSLAIENISGSAHSYAYTADGQSTGSDRKLRFPKAAIIASKRLDGNFRSQTSMFS